MTTMELRQLTETPDYDFLWTTEHLQGKIMFLTLGGSHAYGTNIEGSDVDIRGCALNSAHDLIGYGNFEQVIDTATDTTVYAFNKLINLLVSCNPNTIELLGCKPEHYFVLSDLGQQMIENRKLFLSRAAVNSFGGYANQQLRRLENAIARDKLGQREKEEHILGSLRRSVLSFERRYDNLPEGSIKLYTAPSQKEDMEIEVVGDINLKGYPARGFAGIINDLNSTIRDYEKLSHRNKKDNAHLNKHAMHLIRLYLTGLDILEKGEIITYRGDDLELLMSIRNGTFQNEDGTYREEFFDMVNVYEQRLKYAAENTSLPKTPDLKKVEEFVMEVNRVALKMDSAA